MASRLKLELLMEPWADWITDAPLLSPGYKTAVAFALMVAMLIWRPSGLFKGRVF